MPGVDTGRFAPHADRVTPVGQGVSLNGVGQLEGAGRVIRHGQRAPGWGGSGSGIRETYVMSDPADVHPHQQVRPGLTSLRQGLAHWARRSRRPEGGQPPGERIRASVARQEDPPHGGSSRTELLLPVVHCG